MKKGKFESSGRRGFGGKTVALLLALVLVVGGVIGGTLAWLTATTAPVQNTFTTSDIDITLTETGATNNANSYKMVPGNTIAKDPKVTVVAGSEKCYLFVKLEKSSNFDSFLTYEMATEATGATGWTALDGVTGVYYRVVDASTTDQEFGVLKDNQVSVKDTVTKAAMNGLTTDTYPTLTVTAYASQYMKNNTESFTAAEAWANINPVTP